MPAAWRIVKDKFVAVAFSGEGARQIEGRWNSQGVAMVYTSEHKSLAALETLVHVDAKIPVSYRCFRVDFSEALVERLTAELPPNWQSEPPTDATRQLGDLWIRESRSAVLAVPSALIPEEWNYLLNPNNTGFEKVTIGKPVAFAFDPRLLT